MTCAAELHPERARKYNYCLAPECQEKNARGLTMVAIGMNKAAEELRILDDTTLNELASGKFRDQRRARCGQRASPGLRPSSGSPCSTTPRDCPAEIAGKLGISSHLVTQIILSAKNRGKS